MNLQHLRKTLISLSLKHQPSNPIYLFNLPHFSTQIEKPTSEITDYLITQHNFSQETASKSSKFLTSFKDYKRSDFVIDFFKQNGFSNTQLEKLVLSEPRVLAVDVDKRIRVLVQGIRDLGFSDDELGNLLCEVKEIFTVRRSISLLISSISVLQSILESNSDVIKLLKACNWYLVNDLNKKLLPNVDLLMKSGVCKLQIRQTLFNFSRFFLLYPEIMKDCMRRVDEMGLEKSSKMYIHGVRVVSAMSLENWESKLMVFKTFLGFTDADILSVFRRVPQVLAISERKILVVSKLLLSSESVDKSYLVQHADLLTYSASRIKPRLEIISALLSKSLIKKRPSMTTICKTGDKDFMKKFVLPFVDEIGEVGEKYLLSRGHKAL